MSTESDEQLLSILRVSDAGGLNIEIEDGRATVLGNIYDYALQTKTLVNNSTNYIFVDIDGIVKTNTSGFPSDTIQLAVIITSGGSISSITDKRSFLHTPKTTLGGNKSESYAIDEDTCHTTWKHLAAIYWPGSSIIGVPTAIKVVYECFDSSHLTDIKIRDMTNSNLIAKVLGLPFSNNLIIGDMGNLTNISSGEAVWDIKMRVSIYGNETELEALTILW